MTGLDRESLEQRLRMIDLEDALIQAQHTIEFLHGCLTNEHYKYAYPEMTLHELEKFRAIIVPPEGCGHSATDPNCPSCVRRSNHWQERRDLLVALSYIENDDKYHNCNWSWRSNIKEKND